MYFGTCIITYKILSRRIDPKQEEISFFHGKKTINRDITKRQNKDLKFVFDAVFDETSTQLEVFEHTTKPILRSFLNGYNCTGNCFSWDLMFPSDFSFILRHLLDPFF